MNGLNDRCKFLLHKIFFFSTARELRNFSSLELFVTRKLFCFSVEAPSTKTTLNSWPVDPQASPTYQASPMFNQASSHPLKSHPNQVQLPLTQTHFEMPWSMPPQLAKQYQQMNSGEPSTIPISQKKKMINKEREISSWTIPTSYQFNESDCAKPLIIDGQLPPGAYFEGKITIICFVFRLLLQSIILSLDAPAFINSSTDNPMTYPEATANVVMNDSNLAQASPCNCSNCRNSMQANSKL